MDAPAEQRDPIRDYRDLIVWKESMDLAVDIYALTRSFPREEAFGLTSQLRRAASSIPANIAEGFGRAQRRPFIQFLRVAQGSLKELETHVTLAERVGYLESSAVSGLTSRCELLGKRLVSFVRSLEREGGRT
ncbi:MAG: four helix bundle protein [Rhodanobacter sp.]|uniref:Four helix bundle protein n=1 Tax=Pseudaminobacter salicylatoxidans TaxID=93369 RepID=A0A316C2V9_PSESE|nr:four helix bundle protein [Pseudaminobacter salicylatoxidans]PWJ84040.1 four helix bundle protein [Pseudaminobacter salicylatoxidans]